MREITPHFLCNSYALIKVTWCLDCILTLKHSDVEFKNGVRDKDAISAGLQEQSNYAVLALTVLIIISHMIMCIICKIGKFQYLNMHLQYILISF